MTHRISSTGAVICALIFPLALFADVTGTQTLNSGQELNLSSGAVVTSGGDIQWTGSAINFLGGAEGSDSPGSSGNVLFPSYTQAIVSAEATLFTSSPIPSSSLVVNNLFIMETGGGSFAKLLVTANSGGSITLQFDTFTGSGSPGGGSPGGGGGNSPTITAVLDAGSYTANIAEGSIFVVKGTNLSPSGAGTNGVDKASYPLPPSIDNVSISFAPAGGGNAISAYMVYLYNAGGVNQLAALLPSTVQPGSYQVTVNNGSSASAPFSAQVVASKPGLVTQDSSGSGLAVVQNYNAASPTTYDINRFTTGTVDGSTISPAHPSQIEVAWLTGMDPLPAGMADNTAPNGGNGYDFTQHGVTVTANVGGVTIPAAYGGRTGCCAGEDEIVFTLPANIPTGCVETFYVTVNGVNSQSTFISIAPAGSDACVLQGYTESQLQAIDAGGLATYGDFGVQQELNSSPQLGNFSFASVGGEFYGYTGFQLAAIASLQNNYTGFSTNGCTLIPLPGPNPAAGGGINPTYLDAGNVTVTGPSGSGLNNTSITEKKNIYSLIFQGSAATINGQFLPGTYTISGAGGNDVGQFNSTLVVPTILSVSNMPSVVTRADGLQLNWSGGNSSDIVIASLSATNQVNGVATGGEIVCITTAGAGGINISSSLLNQLPAVTAASLSNGNGDSGIDVNWTPVQSGSNGTFTAPLTAGGSVNGKWAAGSSVVANMPVQ